MSVQNETRPGHVVIRADMTPKEIGQAVKVGFSPLKAMSEGWSRAFNPTHRWRDPVTGRFVPRTHR